MVAIKDPDAIMKKVQDALRNSTPEGASVRVLSASPRPDVRHADWWYVTVTYQLDPYNAYKYFDTLSMVEEKLESEHLNVLLVPQIVAPPPDMQ